MKKSSIVAVLCLAAVTGFSQTKKFTFKVGSEFELPRKSNDLSFIGNDKDGIINLSYKKKELSIVRFDSKSLNQTADQQVELEEATKNFNSEVLVDFGTDYYWVHSDWDKGEETESLYYDKIDIAKGRIAATNQKMFQTTRIAGDLVRTGYFYSAKVDNKYQFNFDADRKNLLVTYRLYPEEKKDKKNYDNLGFQVFDEKMKLRWGGEFRMPYTEAIMDNSDFSVDSEGNAYLLAKVYDSDSRKEKNKETGGPAYHYELMKFSKGSKTPVIATISLDDFFIKESVLIESSTHEMLVACTYSKKSKSNGTDGVFLATLDPSGKVKKYKNGYYEFPLEELQKFETARQKRRMERKDDYEAPNLKVRNIVVDPDGSVFIACEEYRVESQTYTTSNGSTYTTYTYYYEDILGCRINAAGQFDWMRKIPKKQRGTRGRGTMSFKLVSDASGYYLLYLDNIKNIDLQEDETPKYHVDGYGGQVVVASISPKGEVSKEIVFNTRDEDIMIFPSAFRRINGNQFIGRASVKRGGFKPLLITYQ